MESDFKQIDLAFSEEVTLRLKFEYKINEIHTAHRELSIKQQKLLEDMIVQKKKLFQMSSAYEAKATEVESLQVNIMSLE